MSRSPMGRALAVALAAGGLLLAACGAAGCDRRRGRLAARWSDEPVAGLLDAEALAALRQPAGWPFAGAEERKLWSRHGFAEASAEGESWRLAAQEKLPRLTRRANLTAKATATVVLRATSWPERSASGRRGNDSARLYWSSRHGRFARDQSVEVAMDPGASEWRFAVGGHPEWQGTIRSLRFDLPLDPGEEVALAAVEFQPADEPLAPFRGRPWSVTLGAETRAALLAPPGQPLERRFDLAREATQLRFAVGLLPGQDCALEVELAGGGSGRALWARTLRPPADERWQEATIDLAELAGREVELAFTSRLAGPCPRATPTALVAVPEVLGASRAGGAASDAELPPNIVLISIDTLRPDHLGLYGYERQTSPRLDAWARRAVVFETAVAAAPWTLPSHTSMLTGTSALAHGVNTKSPAPASLPFLAEILRAHGYSTAAWTGGSWLAPVYGFGQGFDVFHLWTAPDDWEGELAAHAPEAAAWLDRSAVEPFFLFFHTFEVHAPYFVREPFYGRLAGAGELPASSVAVYDKLLPPVVEDGFVINKQLTHGRDGPRFVTGATRLAQARLAYDSGIAYADRELGRLLDVLAERELAERTLVVVTSDHGEGLGEEGLVSHGYLHDTNLLVPLAIALPGGRAGGRRIATQVSLVDLVPTVLDLAGLPVPGGLEGRSLAALVRGASAESARIAVAYAGSSNLGLALRVAGRRKYVLNDTPWPPVAGFEGVVEVGRGRGRERAATDLGADELAVLRAEAQRLLERGAGLHLRLWNGEPSDLAGTLRGPCVHPLTVKMVSGRPGILAWRQRQEASFRVASGEVLELRFDSPGSPCLTATGAIGTETGFSVSVDPARPGEELLGLTAEGWQDLAPGAAPRTGLRAWRVGPTDAPAADPAQADPELLERLRALGYVE